MGANGSSSRPSGSGSFFQRTHTDTGYRIDGHKVVLQKHNPTQAKNILHSQSDSPTYIIGIKQKDGSIRVHSIDIFSGHDLSVEVNLKYDKNGRLLPYNGTETHSHSHSWTKNAKGDMRRKTFGTHEPIPQSITKLFNDIDKFNLKNKK